MFRTERSNDYPIDTDYKRNNDSGSGRECERFRTGRIICDDDSNTYYNYAYCRPVVSIRRSRLQLFPAAVINIILYVYENGWSHPYKGARRNLNRGGGRPRQKSKAIVKRIWYLPVGDSFCEKKKKRK
jgi:hypothetical protein